MLRWLLTTLLVLVSLPALAAERIVSLAPFLTDLIVQLDAGERLVGVLDDGNLPPELATVTRVGSHQSLPLERILATRPDLVLAWTSGNPPELLARLEQLGLRVERFDPQSLAQIAEVTLAVGLLSATEARAAVLVDSYHQQLAQLHRPLTEDSPRVFIQLWDDPLYTISDAQLMGDALRHCGARNIFADLAILAPQIGRESVIAADPDVIILLADERKLAAPWLQRWRQFPHLRAVRHEALFVLDSNTLVRPTPAAVEGVRVLCELVWQQRGFSAPHADTLIRP